MRRVLMLMLGLLILLNCIPALAEASLSAYDLAVQMAAVIPEMADIKEMPLQDGPQNRAIWTDTRTDLICDLVVYGDAAAAMKAAVAQSTRDTAVRNAGTCALSLNSSLGAEAILSYQLALAEILGVEINQGDPDYILNVNTRKMHDPACESVADIKESNRQEYYKDYFGDRELLIELGYAPCKICNP